jgi:hypothetical protein
MSHNLWHNEIERYAYWMTVPGAKLIVASHRGLLEVYELADRAYAFAVFQFPRIETSPAIFMVWPYTVVTTSSKVTATDVAAAHELEVELVGVLVLVELLDPVPVVVGVELLTPEVGVWFAGHDPVEAVE